MDSIRSRRKLVPRVSSLGSNVITHFLGVQGGKRALIPMRSLHEVVSKGIS